MDPGEQASRGLVGVYTTAKVTRGRVERIEAHGARLRRDAARIGLAPPPARDVEALLLETAADRFADGDGILRIDWSGPPGAGPALRATARPVGSAPEVWRAIVADVVHPGPEDRANTKHVDVPAWEAGREALRTAGVDEALLLDAEGRLVEGSRSNLLVVRAPGAGLATPAMRLGPVEGLGLELVRRDHPDLAEIELAREALPEVAELIAVNVVRGAMPIVELDGRPVGDGRPGPWAERLAPIFGRPWTPRPER